MESLELQSYEAAFADTFQVERHQVSSGYQMCSQCGALQFCPGTGIAYTCRAGTYFSTQTAIDQSTCITCSSGTYSPAVGATQCTVCPAGDTDNLFLSKPGFFTFVVFIFTDAGYISSTGASACTPCSKGSYQTGTGQSACITCSAGTFSPSVGATQCTICPGGDVDIPSLYPY